MTLAGPEGPGVPSVEEASCVGVRLGWGALPGVAGCRCAHPCRPGGTSQAVQALGEARLPAAGGPRFGYLVKVTQEAAGTAREPVGRGMPVVGSRVNQVTSPERSLAA